MNLLRRALGLGALLLFLLSATLVAIPQTIVEGIMGQEGSPDAVWVRLFGAAGITLALFHVLISRKIEDLWWWSWALVIYNGLIALIALVHVSIGLSEGSAAWPWWLLGATAALFTALYVVGLAKAGQEKPFA